MDVLFNIEGGDNFKSVVEDIIDNLYQKENKTSAALNETTINTIKEEIKKLIIKTSCNNQKVHEILEPRGYEADKIKLLSSILTKQQDELLYLTLINFNSSFGEVMTKFDWMLKLIYGTSELKKLKYPTFQLIINTINNGECRQLGYDISKDVLNKMITVLEDKINTL